MLIGERIAQRMREVEISQAELARRVGISQQAVGKLVHGDSRSSVYLHKIARELRTTPAFLSGEISDPEDGAPTDTPLDADQRELVDTFKLLSPADRRAILQIVRSMKPAKAEARLHSTKVAFRGEEGAE